MKQDDQIDTAKIQVTNEHIRMKSAYWLDLPPRYPGMDYRIRLIDNDYQSAKEARQVLLAWLRDWGVCK